MQISREIRVPSDGKELRHCAGAFRGAVGAVGAGAGLDMGGGEGPIGRG